jgi:hypothetical protein
MRRTLFIVSLPVLASFVACSGDHESEIDPPSTSSAEALSAAVPKPDWVQLDVAALGPSMPASAASATTTSAPSPLPAQCQPGPTASLAQASQQVSTQTNAILAGVLGLVSEITKNPPAISVPDHAVWAPITSPDSPSIYKLDVQKLGDGTIGFVLTARPKEKDEWHALFDGVTHVVDDKHRAGEIHIDLAQVHDADPAKNDARTGAIVVKFGNVDDNIGIDVMFGGTSGPGTPPTDAQYNFSRRADGAGAFRFVAHSMDPSVPAERVFSIETTWTASGAGMSHATDAASVMPKPQGTVECWAPNAGLVFKAVDGITASGAAGDPACCPTAPSP